MSHWYLVGADVWLAFGVVAVTMIPGNPKLPMQARVALFFMHIPLIAPLGLFAFAIAVDERQ